MKERLKNNKNELFYYAVFFIFAALLVYLFPYSGDDWAWGSEIGLARLSRWFDKYNGRYIGNLLVMLLTRSKFLCVIIKTINLTLFGVFAKRFFDCKNNLSIAFTDLFIIAMPLSIFVQSIVWTSGYTNYVPPITLALVYFILIKNIFDEAKPQYSKWVAPVTFAIAFISALFMENLTLYNIAIGFLVIAYVFIKFKKAYAAHISFFAGSIVGAIVMFTNSAYGIIASSGDSYRSTAFDGNIKKTIVRHIDKVCNFLFVDNIYLITIITILSLAIALIFFLNNKTSKFKCIGIIASAFNILSYLCIVLVKIAGNSKIGLLGKINKFFTIKYTFGVIVLYCLAIFIINCLCVKDKSKRDKLLLMFISIPIMVAPLLIVNPIGPRNFFPPYLLLVFYMIGEFAVITDGLTPDKKILKAATGIILAVIAVIYIGMYSIYSDIHFFDKKRLETINTQLEDGYKTVSMVKLPHSEYVWMGTPNKKLWRYRYKVFNDIDTTIKFEYIEPEEFFEWEENYNKTHQ